MWFTMFCALTADVPVEVTSVSVCTGPDRMIFILHNAQRLLSHSLQQGAGDGTGTFHFMKI